MTEKKVVIEESNRNLDRASGQQHGCKIVHPINSRWHHGHGRLDSAIQEANERFPGVPVYYRYDNGEEMVETLI